MINVFYTYYGQRCMIDTIKSSGVYATIIDDGYPEPLGSVSGCDVYRINEDIPWNIPGAKNLGFHVLDGWILALPIDHIVSIDMLKHLDNMSKDINTAYYLGGRNNGIPEPADKSPHDMVLIHKSAYETIGGYDEDLSGTYGYEDRLFYDMCCNTINAVERFDLMIDWIPQGYTNNHNRDYQRNLSIYNSKNKYKMTTPKLRFTWQKVE